MFPGVAIDNHTDIGLNDTIASSKLGLRDATAGVFLANRTDLLCRQFGEVVATSANLSALSDHVSGIVCIRAEE